MIFQKNICHFVYIFVPNFMLIIQLSRGEFELTLEYSGNQSNYSDFCMNLESSSAPKYSIVKNSSAIETQNAVKNITQNCLYLFIPWEGKFLFRRLKPIISAF